MRFFHLNSKCFFCERFENKFFGICVVCLSNFEVRRLSDFFSIDDSTGIAIMEMNTLGGLALKSCKYQQSPTLFKELIIYGLNKELQILQTQGNEFVELFNCLSDVNWVPIPLHWTRLRDRGMNQAELVALELSKVFGGSVCHALKRPKENQSLTSMGKGDREKVSEGIFIRVKGFENLRNVVIVDDLVTTGSTLFSAIHSFKVDERFERFQFATALKGYQNMKTDWEFDLSKRYDIDDYNPYK